jgi:hypothetical protein
MFGKTILFAFLLSATSVLGSSKKEEHRKEWRSSRVLDSSAEERLFGHFNPEEFTSRYADRMIKYFVENPVTLRERECYDKAYTSGYSIDFVLDIAASPSHDKEDVMSATSPIGQYLELFRAGRSPTRSYFDFIVRFIDIVSYGLKPELAHSVFVSKDETGKVDKFYLRGRLINESFDVTKLGGEFNDAVRNLKTLWPVSTSSKPETRMAKILVNNLGRMTKLALWNRDNGLPTVLNAVRHSKPVYTVLITDGSSGLSLQDLVDIKSGADLSRTSVVDIGNHRFVDRLSWEDAVALRGIYTLTSPQTLPAMGNSIRTMACLVGSNFKKQQQ